MTKPVAGCGLLCANGFLRGPGLSFSARRMVVVLAATLFLGGAGVMEGAQTPADTEHADNGGASVNSSNAAGPAAGAPAEKPVYIREYRVVGAHQLSRQEVEAAVYPFLGPGRTSADVEQARAALEKAYQSKGYQAASVQIPPQQVKRGVVFLQVAEGRVGKLRVQGARYFLPSAIKAQARSLAEGKVINFNDVNRDIVALNQLPDRQVTPSLRAGEEPGTVDIDLNVKDGKLHAGVLELNNRYSADTTPLRLNGSVSYNNLWQLGHSVGMSFQLAPERLQDTEVFSGYYLARLPEVDWLSLMVQGTKQDSNVSTLGSTDVTGRGEIIGARAIITLPGGKDFYQSISMGMDYKAFRPVGEHRGGRHDPDCRSYQLLSD